MNESILKVLKKIDLDHYGSYQVRGSYGSMKEKTLTLRIEKDLDDRIQKFLAENTWWTKGELTRCAVILYLDAVDAQKKESK